ncbi:MAG: GNAT family N-acetyltransferase, partial [Planctomycetota bacterium]
LDPTVHPDLRRTGIGTELVRRAADLARDAGVEWLHVDFVPELTPFYERCGFRPTEAGLMKLTPA